MADPRLEPAEVLLTADERGRMHIVSHQADKPGHELGQLLLEFWQSRWRAGRLLHKSEIPSREILPVVPFLSLFEPANLGGTDWRCRVIGTGVSERIGAPERRGRLLSEVNSPQMAARRAANYKRVIDTLTPNVARGRILGTGHEFLNIEVVHVPVAANADTPWLLGGMFFFN